MSSSTHPDETPLLGMWMMLRSQDLAAAASAEGYGFVAFDVQHGNIAPADVPALSYAVRSVGNAEVAVRASTLDFAELGLYADAGADMVIVPLISSAEQAAECVRALNYPPMGERSWGPTADVITSIPDPSDADRRPRLLVMIENRPGLENLESILEVPGVDGVYIGPSDLAFAIGELPGSASEQMEQTIAHIRSSAQEKGMVAAIHCVAGAEARPRVEQGFDIVTSSIDVVAARSAFARDLDHARS